MKNPFLIACRSEGGNGGAMKKGGIEIMLLLYVGLLYFPSIIRHQQLLEVVILLLF